jgi:uncharacterized protein (TIGR03437 family)
LQISYFIWARIVLLPVIALSGPLARASEADALAISANIRARHLPFGTVMDPIHVSSVSNQIVGYTRCGDSALWTGAYLAAESFRYRVTGSLDALGNVRTALAGLKALTDVTGDNRLARCMVPAASPYAAGIASEEAPNGVHVNGPWLWVGNISRDQIVGAFFGLGVAYDMVPDPAVRSAAAELATRLIGYISRHQWSPDDNIESTFRLRPESLQMLLEVARHVDPANTVSGPFFVAPMGSAVAVDVLSNSSYFKFNLDYMSFYHLVALRNAPEDRDAYTVVRSYTAGHQNVFFDIIDRALCGPEPVRDAETRSLLDQWLKRPRRDFYVDVSGTVQRCFGSPCQPVPVPLRPPTDFLWQRDPFQLSGGGSGLIENAGVDYILPYWMARFYGVIPGPVQSAAAPLGTVAPGSLASLYGESLSTAGAALVVTDAAGARRTAQLLYVSPEQINFLVPEGAAPGPATFTVSGQTFPGTIDTVAPGLFSMTGTGSGVAAATAIATQVANPQIRSDVPVFSCAASVCTAVPVRLGIDTPIYATFFGTGIRNRSSLSNVTVTIHGVQVPVLYAGPSPGSIGLDQVNVALTLNLRGAGEADVVVTVDGHTSNAVSMNLQ